MPAGIEAGLAHHQAGRLAEAERAYREVLESDPRNFDALLNRFESEWRWLLGREDSPWYPTIRILRQPRPGDWDSVIRQAAARLADHDFGVRRH